MKYNSTTLFFCIANCCSLFYHLPVWYSYKFLCNFRRELVCRALQSMIHCSELGESTWTGLPPVESRENASYSWSVLLSYKLICMWAFSSTLTMLNSILNVAWYFVKFNQYQLACHDIGLLDQPLIFHSQVPGDTVALIRVDRKRRQMAKLEEQLTT